MNQVVIASRLHDGVVVYLHEAGHWVESIDAAALAGDEAESTRLMTLAEAAPAATAVVDPYLIDVVTADGRRRPVVMREAIRAEGPTVQTEFN